MSICVPLNHFAVQRDWPDIVNQLYFNKNVKLKNRKTKLI